MAFKAWITDDERRDIEAAATDIILKTRDEILSCPGWQLSESVKAAEEAVEEAYRRLMDGSGSLTDYRVACERWKAAGLINQGSQQKVEGSVDPDPESGAIDTSCSALGAPKVEEDSGNESP
jgi:hypothetical protein